LHGVSHA
jgi:hypothetical protein